MLAPPAYLCLPLGSCPLLHCPMYSCLDHLFFQVWEEAAMGSSVNSESALFQAMGILEVPVLSLARLHPLGLLSPSHLPTLL